MKQRILFIMFSVLFIAGMLGHHFTNRSFIFAKDYWTVDLGEQQEDRYMAGDGAEGRMLTTAYYSLNRGDYVVTVNYTASAPGSSLVAEAYEGDLVTTELPVAETPAVLNIPVHLERDSTDFRLHVEKGAAGTVTIGDLRVGSDRPLNSDYAFLAVMMALFAVLLYGILFSGKRKISQETAAAIIVITAAGFLVSAPYLRPDLFRSYDMSYHAYKIQGIKDGLLKGQFPVYVYPYTVNSYGYLQALYPNLFVYPAAILRMFGVTVELCYKSLMFAINLGTGWMAYAAAKKLLGKRRTVPLLIAVLYMTGLYRVGSSMWMRSALGEVTAIMFIPLVVLGLYELLAGDRKKWWYLAVAYSGLLQCHMLSCIMVSLFSVTAGLFYVDVFFKEKRWKELFKIFGCVLAFNAWYLIPFVVYYTQGNLDLESAMYEGGWWMKTVQYVTELFQIHTPRVASSRGPQTNSLGPVGLLCMVFGIIGSMTQKNKDRRQGYLAVLAACGVIFTLLITNIVPWELLKRNPVIDQVTETIQFPYRFLVIAHACLVFSGVGWLYESGLLKKYASHMTCVLFLAALITMQTIVTTFANERKTYPPGTPMVATVKEYFIRDTDFSDLNRWIYESDESKVRIIDYTLDGNRAEVRLICQQEGQFIDVPIFNYPGYGAYNEQGQRLPVATGSNNRVRVNLPASGEEQVITVKFVGKKIFVVGYAITIGAFLGLLGYRNRKRLAGLAKRTKE